MPQQPEPDTDHVAVSNAPIMPLAMWRARRRLKALPQEPSQEQPPPPSYSSHIVSLAGAGNAADLYDYMGDPNHVPKIFKQDERFLFLARDPAHRGKIRPSGVREAISILFAEKIGLVRWPVARYPGPEYDFVDGTGAAIDVKTPISPDKGETWDFSLDEVFASIHHELHTPQRPDATPTKVLLDVSYLGHDHYKLLHNKLDQSLSDEARQRLIQVSVPFLKLGRRAINRYRAQRCLQAQHPPPNLSFGPKP